MSSAQILDTTRPAYVWNGTNWVPITQTRNDAVLYQPNQPDVSNLDIGTVWVDSNDYLGTGIVNPNGFGYISTTPSTQTILADSDFDNINLQAGNSITINAASATNTITISSTISNLNSLIDTTISSPSNNQLLAYNSSSSQWVNKDMSDVYLTTNTASTTYLTIVNASATYEPNITYNSASPSGIGTGQLWIDTTDPTAPILKVYNGSTWIEMSGAGGGGDVFDTLLLMGV